MPGNSSDDAPSPPASSLQFGTLFDNLNSKAGKKDIKSKDDDDAKKRLSVERIYQKKTQLEHILLRPDTYIGSVEFVTQNMWVYDGEDEGMVNRSISFVPGLYKIFDEILVNAADNKQRDAKMDCIKVDIDSENNTITIWNNGKGIPVVEHKVEKMFVPALIFGHLLTSSNYNDEEKKVTGGRNGYGAKLCNIFSLKFSVETACNEYKKVFKQTWTDNMNKTKEAKILPFKGTDYTKITFKPDLAKFKMEVLDKDIIALMSRRAFDVAGSSRGVKVFLNGKKLPVKNFKDYIDLYLKDQCDENDQPLKLCHENVNDRWEVAITQSNKGLQQISFVNSIATTKGGRHVDHVADQITNKLIEVVKRKNKGGVAIKPFQVKNHLWVFVNCLIENPTFDSQTKENMTLQVKSFGSKCLLSDKFITAVNKVGIVENILQWVRFKAQTQLNKKCSSSKHSKLKGVPKLEDANDAGTKNSVNCTLILTEGDSAKSLAVSGLGVVGRDRYGVFPLKGKVLNVREATVKQIMENAEINNIIKIMGLQYKKQYSGIDDLKSLRYGKLMIMADQDQDGSHIKGLLINFIHHNWPSLLQLPFLEEFITPIVKVSKAKQELSFYSLPEFEEWKQDCDNWHTWKVKYYKGLGTSTAKEAKEYFSDMDRHRVPFKYSGPEDDAAITLAFSRKKIEERKEWLTNGMNERKQRRLMGLPELYLYGKGTKHITFNDFINKELILFSNTDNERSIPSLVDGLKPGQRKVIFTCIKRNDKREVKVAQLAGSIAEMSAYHHGENSLQATIVNLAQNFIGSNNINLLQPLGQFGTRLQGGKDAASPRYIFTMLSTLTRLIFHPNDDASLKYLLDDNQRIEPEWYCPIIPMVLVNGAEGIGTGWSTKIPNYNPREIVENIKRLINNEEPETMIPWYKNFRGTIEFLSDHRYVINGEISVIDNTTVEINELPLFVWTQAYKETVLEPMLHGSEKTPALITDYKEYHTDTTVRFVVTMSEEKLARAEADGLHKIFKLQSTFATSCMVLFDSNGVLHRYDTVEAILKEFYQLRLERYKIRKDHLEGMLTAESSKLDNQARFILEKIQGKIVLENKPKKDVIRMLTERGYDSDPVKAWKEAQAKLLQADEDASSSEDEEAIATKDRSGGPDYDYLMGMSMWSLVKEFADELMKKKDAKADQLNILRKKSPSDLWLEDLEAFITELNKVEQQEQADELGTVSIISKASKTGKGRIKKVAVLETKPSPMGRRVAPIIDVSLKQRAEKAAEKKAKEKRPKVSRDDDLDENDENDETSPRVKTERKKGTGGSGGRKLKQTTLNFKSSDKKKRKRNAWSDSESNDEKASGSDLDSIAIDIAPRERAPRRAAAAAVKFNLSDSDNDLKSTDSDSDEKISKPIKFNDDDDDDDFTISKKEPETNNVDHKPPVFGGTISDSDDESIKKVPKKPIKKPAPVKSKPTEAKSGVISKDAKPKIKRPRKKKDGGSDDDLSSKVKKTTATSKNKFSKIDSDFSDDMNDDEFVPKVAQKKQSAKKDSDVSDDEFFSKVVQKKQPAKKDSDVFDDEFFSKVVQKKQPAKKDSDISDDEFAPKVTENLQPTTKSSDMSDDEFLPLASRLNPSANKDSDLSDDSEFAPKVIPVPKKQPAKKKRPLKKSSDHSDDDFFTSKKKPGKKDSNSSDDEFISKKPVAKRKKKNSDSENEVMAGGDRAPRSRAGRTKAPIKYNFGDSEDSD